MRDLLFGFVAGFGLTWALMSFRRGSNPAPLGRKPAPPSGPPEQPLAARLIRYLHWRDEQVRRTLTDPSLGEPWLEDCKPESPAGPPNYDWRRRFNHENTNPPAGAPPLKLRRNDSTYGWGPRQLPPTPPAPGMRREYLWTSTQMAKCGGPCWETQDPSYCTCGDLWRDVPIRLGEGQVQRGGFGDGPTTPKPLIKPQPTGGRQLPPLL